MLPNWPEPRSFIASLTSVRGRPGQAGRRRHNAGFINTGDPATIILLNILGSRAQNYLTDRMTPQTPAATTSASDLHRRPGVVRRRRITRHRRRAVPLESGGKRRARPVEYDAGGFYDVCCSRPGQWRPKRPDLRRNLTDAQQMFDVGTISNFEVLRAKTELGARKSELVAAKNALRLAEANLRRVLFVAENTRLQLDPSIEWRPADTPVADYVARALESRPEIAALRKALEAAEQQVKAAKGQYLPTVGLQAEYSNTDEGGLATPDGWTFGLGAQYDIWENGNMGGGRPGLSLEHQLADLERSRTRRTQAHQHQDAMARRNSAETAFAQEGAPARGTAVQEGVGTQSKSSTPSCFHQRPVFAVPGLAGICRRQCGTRTRYGEQLVARQGGIHAGPSRA